MGSSASIVLSVLSLNGALAVGNIFGHDKCPGIDQHWDPAVLECRPCKSSCFREIIVDKCLQYCREHATTLLPPTSVPTTPAPENSDKLPYLGFLAVVLVGVAIGSALLYKRYKRRSIPRTDDEAPIKEPSSDEQPRSDEQLCFDFIPELDGQPDVRMPNDSSHGVQSR